MPDWSTQPLDPIAAARWQRLAQRQALGQGAAWLHEEVGARMAERLAWIKKTPNSWVDWRSSLSGLKTHQKVAKNYPNSTCFIAPSTAESAQAASKIIAFENSGLKRLWGDISGKNTQKHIQMTRTVPDEGAQFVWANMSLHTEPDPAKAIQEWHRMLSVDGFLMFSCLGPDTLRELRHVYDKLNLLAPAHPLIDMHDWGDLLVHSGFAEPVMDMERIVLSFPSAKRALEEIRGLGRNLHPQRTKHLLGQSYLEKLLSEMVRVQAQKGHGHAYELTFEIIYGHAFKPPPRLKVSAESAISMRDMRAMLTASKKT